MRKTVSMLLAAGLMLASCSHASEERSCDLNDFYTYSENDGPAVRVSGVSVDRELPSVMIIEEGGDWSKEPYYLVRLTDGRFSADLPLKKNVIYALCVPSMMPETVSMPESMRALLTDYTYGAVRKCVFFADSDRLKFSVDGDGGPSLKSWSGRGGNSVLSACMKDLDSFRKKEMEALKAFRDSTEMYSPEYLSMAEASNDESLPRTVRDSLWHEVMMLSYSGEQYTEQGKAVAAAEKEEYQMQLEHVSEYLAAHEPSLALLSVAYRYLSLASALKLNADSLVGIYRDAYAGKVGNEHMNNRIQGIISDMRTYVGSRYSDFTLPDRNGAEYSLSSLIDGKIAVVELWASWCHSCRVNHRAFIPVYEKYKDQGFTVVGAAREYKTPDRWLKALDDDGYPWTCLVAFEEDHGIWTEYGASSSAGAVFLIDRDGTVVKIDPSPEYVEEFILSHQD